MKITVVGAGYVGLAPGACLAERGNPAVCLDIDPRKIDMLQRGEIAIHEPGLATRIGLTNALALLAERVGNIDIGRSKSAPALPAVAR